MEQFPYVCVCALRLHDDDDLASVSLDKPSAAPAAIESSSQRLSNFYLTD